MPDRPRSREPNIANSTGGRATEIVRAAYSLIAEKGFEGLRTRDVANKIGINIGTLHYHFPTKENLIQGVVSHLMRELQITRTTVKDSDPALKRLRAEFTDIRVRLRESPEQLVVLTELAVRALRDPAIARILAFLDEGWHKHLVSIFKAGIAEGTFRSDLDADATARALMVQLRGLGYHTLLKPDVLSALLTQIETQTVYWVQPRPSAKRKK
jgi:AcrR family transcriptional regulator